MSNTMLLEMGILTIDEAKRYKRLKREIGEWWSDRLKIGAALREIRDQKLYRGEYKNFEDFCVAEYEIKHSQAYRLIEAAEVKASVETSPNGGQIQNERQARALAVVPAQQRDAVLNEAAKGGKVTAKAITEAARKNGHAAPDYAQALDKTGFPIPDKILDDWRHAESFAGLLRQLSDVKCAVERGLKDQDLAFRDISNTLVAALENDYAQLKCVLPYAVCTTCQGHSRERCALCKGRGYISEFAYRQYVPREMKEIRRRARA